MDIGQDGLCIGVNFKRCDECQRDDCTNCFYRRMYAELIALPSSKDCLACERVEVVRCKDCTSYGEGGWCRNCNLWRDPDDFCSQGKRAGAAKK